MAATATTPTYKLPRINIIVATDSVGGIGKDGSIPFPSDLKYFAQKTTEDYNGVGATNDEWRRNVVIVGRATFESFPLRKLKGRIVYVVSSTAIAEQLADSADVKYVPSLAQALKDIGKLMSPVVVTPHPYLAVEHYTGAFTVWIGGGERLYNEAMSRYAYLIDEIHVTTFPGDYGCDRFFRFPASLQNHLHEFEAKTPDHIRDKQAAWSLRTVYDIFVKHPEHKYLDLMKEILETGDTVVDRTGVGTKCLFGRQLVFDISETIPLVTTKKVNHAAILKELLWFIRGCTDSKVLESQGVGIWKLNSTREFLDKRGLTENREGDVGPVYGFQWRHFGADYRGADADYTPENGNSGIDQLQKLIEGLRDDPFGRRHILTAWNVSDIDQMALPPCHMFAQFHVVEKEIDSDEGNGGGEKVRYLDCLMYQRSYDAALGAPFNMGCYSILTHILATLLGYRPRRFIHTIGNAHVYLNHIDGVKRQLERTPFPFPTVTIHPRLAGTGVAGLEMLTLEDVTINGYHSWPYIAFDMAV